MAAGINERNKTMHTNHSAPQLCLLLSLSWAKFSPANPNACPGRGRPGCHLSDLLTNPPTALSPSAKSQPLPAKRRSSRAALTSPPSSGLPINSQLPPPYPTPPPKKTGTPASPPLCPHPCERQGSAEMAPPEGFPIPAASTDLSSLRAFTTLYLSYNK